nr:hypothetical protein Iba_chr11fCG6610 [Ipomoea batatas]
MLPQEEGLQRVVLECHEKWIRSLYMTTPEMTSSDMRNDKIRCSSNPIVLSGLVDKKTELAKNAMDSDDSGMELCS